MFIQLQLIMKRTLPQSCLFFAECSISYFQCPSCSHLCTHSMQYCTHTHKDAIYTCCIMTSLQYFYIQVQSCLSVFLSLSLSLLQVFTLVCLFGELWIGCLLLVLLFFCYYIIVYARGRHVWQLRRSVSIQSGRSPSTEYAGTNFEVGGACSYHMTVM